MKRLVIPLLLTLSVSLTACGGEDETIPAEPDALSETEAENVPEKTIGQEQENDEFLIYENPEHKFKISYPSKWQIKKGDGTVIVGFLSDRKSVPGELLENANIAYEALVVKDQTLDEYLEASIKYLEKEMEEFNLLDKVKTQINGEDAVRITYTAKFGEIDVKISQLIFFRDKTAYIVSVGSESGKFDGFLQTAEKIFASFKVW